MREADPSADVEGTDAACKLALLARMAYRRGPARVRAGPRASPASGPSTSYARMLARTPRQLGIARRLPGTAAPLSVRTHLVSNDSILARVDRPFNAVQVSTAHGGDFVFTGRGPGRPDGDAVLADVVEIARSGHRAGVPVRTGRESPLRARRAGRPRGAVLPALRRRGPPRDPGRAHRRPGPARRQRRRRPQVPYRDKGALPFVVTLEPVDEARLGLALFGSWRRSPSTGSAPLVLPMTP